METLIVLAVILGLWFIPLPDDADQKMWSAIKWVLKALAVVLFVYGLFAFTVPTLIFAVIILLIAILNK